MMVAITGASGLLGRHLVERLRSEGVAVVAIVRDPQVRFPEGVVVRQGDVVDPLAIQEALEGVDAVIHAAALVSFNPRRRKEILDVNVDGTRNVVNACLKLGIKNIVHISSVSALGRKPGAVITEEDTWTDQYSSDYGTSKYLAELEVYRGAEEGLTVSLVNPSVILSGTPLHRSSGSLFDYVWKERRFYADGFLNYVDVRDVGDAVHHLLKNPRPGERFTLSAGTLPYLDFFSRVAHQWKKRAPSVRIPGPLVYAFGLAEEIRCWVIGAEPLITRQSAASTTHNFRYDTTKVQRDLGTRYRDLDETIGWCCAEYAQHVNRNK